MAQFTPLVGSEFEAVPSSDDFLPHTVAVFRHSGHFLMSWVAPLDHW